jgi:hypothetical protein
MKQSISKILVVIFASLAFAAGLRAAGPTAEDVGDLGSFGHNVLYMGAASVAVQLTTAACPAPSPTPDPRDQCFTLNPPPASTTFNAENICTIRLSKKATQIGDRHCQRMTLVRVGNAGINKAALIAQGLLPSVVDDLFAGPMTINMSISGGALYVTDASITGNMRLFGD